MAWNVDMLKTEEKRIELEAVIRNSKADIFVLSEFPSNEAGLKLLDSLKSMYRYILPPLKQSTKKDSSLLMTNKNLKMDMKFHLTLTRAG